jgi:SagB-type dehydrogenase family enzyme
MMKIKLPQQETENSISLESAFRKRETKREYLDTPISLTKLSQILFAAQGMRGNGNKLTAPSAQEQYPISTYIVVNKVSGLTSGLYQFNNSAHSLVEMKTGLISEQLEEAALGEQAWVGNAAAIVVLAGKIQSMNQHFSEQPPLNKRGERYNYIEVGAIVQNMQL